MSLHRRSFLRLAAGSAAGLCAVSVSQSVAAARERAFVAPTPVAPVAPARMPTASDITVAIFLSGGVDGLHVLVPYGDPAYAGLRPTLRINPPGRPNGAIEVGAGLGLHPAMAPLLPMIRAGELRVAPAVGLRSPIRSHFESRHLLEVGEERRATTGFLNRALPTGGAGDGGIAALCLSASVPEILAGPALAVSLGDMAAFQEQGMRGRRARVLAEQYADTPGALGEASRRALAAARLLTPGFESALHTNTYTAGDTRGQLAQAARFIRADLGIRLFYCEARGWDTHAGQGADEGMFANRLGSVATNLARFFEDLGAMRGRVRVVCFSEFGRTARENGSGGTDHGTASIMLTLGEGVGGAVSVVDGAHPGVGPNDLFEGRDVRTTRNLSLADFGLGSPS